MEGRWGPQPDAISDEVFERVHRAVIRGRLVAPTRKFVIYARAVGWFVRSFKAVHAHYEFAPGGAGMVRAAESFAAGVESSAKRARNC